MLRLRLDLKPLPKIDCLPFEILGNIFLLMHDEYRNTFFKFRATRASIANANSFIVITHVCRRWRSIAHGIKGLWRRITINGQLKNPASLATSFFTLSHPLSIQLEHEFGRLSDKQDRELNSFYDLLICNPHRISALYLRGYFPDNAWKLFQLPLSKILEVELAFRTEPMANSSRPVKNGKVMNFLGGTSTTLQKLSLTDYTWPRGSKFPCLTNLHLTREYFEERLSESEFFAVMQSLSQTLQVLHIEGAAPLITASSLSSIMNRPATNQISMPALQYIEVYPLSGEPTGRFSLVFLHKLAIPNIISIVWDSSTFSFSDRPPAEHFARVTGLVAHTTRKDCDVLRETTLFVDSTRSNLEMMKAWLTVLPSLDLLALPEAEGYASSNYDFFAKCSTVKVLYICRLTEIMEFISDLEKRRKDRSNAALLPQLQTLIIYTGDANILSKPKIVEISRELEGRGLRKLKLSLDCPMVRKRPHLRTTYTLTFRAGGLEKLLF